MASVTMGQAYEPVEVDLWADDGGAVFHTVSVTRSVLAKMDPLEDKLNEAETPDEIVEAFAAILDVRLKPVEGTKKASTIVKAQWKADKLTIDEVFAFLRNIQEADRPT